MDILLFLLVGLVAGILAKAIMPGTRSEPGGWLLTILLGIAGAFVGGFIGNALGFASYGFWSSILWSTIGALAIIGLLRLFSGRRTV